MPTSPVLGITLLEEGQASGEVTANEALVRIEISGSLAIVDRDLTAPPGSPTEGAAYIVASSPSGAWTGQAGKIAYYFSGWKFFSPKAGMLAYVVDEKLWIAYSTEWHPMQELHSSTEHFTGRYRGSKKVYAKEVTVSALPNSTIGTTAHGITGLDLSEDVRMSSSIRGSSYTAQVPSFIQGLLIELWADATNVFLATNFDGSSLSCVVRMEYCKT